MKNVLGELVDLLKLEKIEENLFRGQSQDLGWGRVFGGQVLGQACSAAVQTVPEERRIHSLHSYFLRPGAVDKPIVYEVDRIRDGKSFTTRRVVAIQNGKAIFNMSASFQKVEDGFEHSDAMPTDVDPPDSVKTDHERIRAFADQLPERFRERVLAERPFDVRIINGVEHPFEPKPRDPQRMYWFKTSAPLSDDLKTHQYLMAYISDYSFLTTSLMPHGVTWINPKMQVATLDHAMWFHRPFRVDDFLLHVIDSPSASGARALVRGRIFTKDGTLVASTAQEGLIRSHA